MNKTLLLALLAWSICCLGAQPPTAPCYRARVITHQDTIRGPENRDNHVNRTFNMLQVIRKFNDTHDLMVCFGLNGPNGMFSLRGWELIPNATDTLAHFPKASHFHEMSEVVGPWFIKSLQNPVGWSGQKFTGGFHGLINQQTKKVYPSAKNLGFRYLADGKELALGQETLCKTIQCVDSVKICTFNTFDKTTNTARYGILYQDTYTMDGDKIHLHATIKALEDVDIQLHYGMQTCVFNPIIGFVTPAGTMETDTSIDQSKKEPQGLPTLIYARKRNGMTLYVKMHDTGAMAGPRKRNVKAFSVTYSRGNTKTYHWVFGNGKNGILKKGETSSYSGYFCISDLAPQDFLRQNP